MELNYQDKISQIEGCPCKNESGDIKLFRCVEENVSEKSFQPQAVLLKPKLQDNCLAWGLSLFSTCEAARQALKNLSKNKRKSINYSRIAAISITDNDGVKHTSGNNKFHYTYYPKKDLDILSKFTLVNDGE